MPHEKETLLENLKLSIQSAMQTLENIEPTTIIYHDSGWTVRDIIDHVAMWEDEKVKGLEAFSQGHVYLTSGFSVEKLHEYNRLMRDARLLCDTEDVYASWRTIRRRLIAIVENMPVNQLKSAMTPPWGGAETMRALSLAQDAIRHQDEHMEHILRICYPS